MAHEERLHAPFDRLEPESAEIVRRCMRGELKPEVLLDLIAELEDLNRSDDALSSAIDLLYTQLSKKRSTG
jgi:hypothetical protein